MLLYNNLSGSSIVVYLYKTAFIKRRKDTVYAVSNNTHRIQKRLHDLIVNKKVIIDGPTLPCIPTVVSIHSQLVRSDFRTFLPDR